MNRPIQKWHGCLGYCHKICTLYLCDSYFTALGCERLNDFIGLCVCMYVCMYVSVCLCWEVYSQVNERSLVTVPSLYPDSFKITVGVEMVVMFSVLSFG